MAQRRVVCGAPRLSFARSRVHFGSAAARAEDEDRKCLEQEDAVKGGRGVVGSHSTKRNSALRLRRACGTNDHALLLSKE